MIYVYVLQNKSGELYIGSTDNLKRRMFEHKKGLSASTKHTSWRLVYYETYISSIDGREREHQLKYHGQAKRHLKNRLKHSLRQS